jgi:hypothetical protein
MNHKLWSTTFPEYKNLRAAMIYNRALNRGGKGVHNRADQRGIDSGPTVTGKG